MNNFAFYHTGLSPLELTNENLLDAQLRAFKAYLNQYGMETDVRPKDWMEVLGLLRNLMTSGKHYLFLALLHYKLRLLHSGILMGL